MKEGVTEITSYKLQATSYKLQVTSYKIQVTSYKLQVTCYKVGEFRRYVPIVRGGDLFTQNYKLGLAMRLQIHAVHVHFFDWLHFF